jgi:nucleotide-binding universal stress UspA family protein
MYSRILVTLEHTPADESIIAHVRKLAKHCGASVLLVHVADGWAARYKDSLALRESEEMREDRSYLEQRRGELEADGIDTDAVLAAGDPAKEIVAAAEREKVDLIAMATHGHGFVNDLIRGSVANEVRHQTLVPVLMVRSEKREEGSGKREG